MQSRIILHDWMLNFHIYGFDSDTAAHRAVSKYLFYGSVHLTYQWWIPSFSQHHPRQMRWQSLSRLCLSDTQASPPTCKCTSTLRIHSHTQTTCTRCETNEWNSSPSIPFHGELCWLWRQCVFVLVSTLCAILCFLSLQQVCVCACWVYLLTSHCLSMHMYTQLLL